jgi:hypothetical protein
MKRIVFLLLVVVVLAGCKSSKHLATSEKNVQVSSYLTSKLQLTIPGKKGGSMSVGGTMKMKTHERVQISLLMPILRTEVARVEVTPDGVLLVDRMNKRFVRATKDELKKRISGRAGLTAHLGTTDVPVIIKSIEEGDKKAEFVLDAMIYNVAKAIGGAATVLCGKIDAILLTGGIAYSDYVISRLKKRISFLAPIIFIPEKTKWNHWLSMR